MKFKIGDPVWVRTNENERRCYGVPAGEYPSVIISAPVASFMHEGVWYHLEPFDDTRIPCMAHETRLRPRRDDYQQHEPRVSWTDLRDSLRAPEKEPA